MRVIVYKHFAVELAHLVSWPSIARSDKDESSIRLGESEQRNFPAKTLPLLVNEVPKPRSPERCYGSDVWYPTCDVLVPHVLPNPVL